MSSGAVLIEPLLALGMLVVVPLGVRLHPDLGARWSLPFVTAGVLAALSLLRVRVLDLSPRTTAVAVVAVVGAPPIVAAGFALAGVLQIAGAVVLTLGLFVLTWLTLRLVVPGARDAVGGALLIVSSVAVVVPMLLAVQWAVGWNFGTPALAIPAMARTHGVLNALGFSLCGIIGWLRIADGAAAERR